MKKATITLALMLALCGSAMAKRCCVGMGKHTCFQYCEKYAPIIMWGGAGPVFDASPITGKDAASSNMTIYSIHAVGESDTACIGFTGPSCDRSYPATSIGLDCANQEAPKDAPSQMLLGKDTIILTEPVFCSDDEFRAYLKDGRNWLPWNRHKRPARINPRVDIRGFAF